MYKKKEKYKDLFFDIADTDLIGAEIKCYGKMSSRSNKINQRKVTRSEGSPSDDFNKSDR